MAYIWLFKFEHCPAEQQETPAKVPGKTEKLSSPGVVQPAAAAHEDGVQEGTVPTARTPQIMGEADAIWETLRRLHIETGEPTTVCTTGKSDAAPPYMQVTIEDVQVRCGEMAKFDAIIEGNPQPIVAWFKGISLLVDSERVRLFSEGTSYSLILYHTSPEDGGVYTCMAKNAGGEVLCKAELVVQEDKKSQEAKKESTRRKLHSFYEVKQEIARGSFSLLKRVVHKENRMLCAAKFMPLRSRTRDQAYRERDVLATLSHDRITRLLDEFETRKTLILVLELCSNEELLDRLFKKTVVTEAETAPVTFQSRKQKSS
ncbi:obscurin-like [Heteronotia binoei]|uniref:obscurin-like n=1 Tax=Heteronotia binoei TaxID=13085 RepID=UPI0029316A20|nr:obscurin-like [Heteronotia binoei]